jgi:hypothetical protein
VSSTRAFLVWSATFSSIGGPSRLAAVTAAPEIFGAEASGAFFF